MKKLIALVIAIAMMAVVAVPVFADAPALPDPYDHYIANQPLTQEDPKGEVDVHYKVESSYEVKIPADLVFVEPYGYKFLADVEANNVIIGQEQTLTINLTSENDFKMMPYGEGTADGVLYTVGYIQNKKYDNDNNKFVWPEVPKGDNSNMSTQLTEAYGTLGYTEAEAEKDNAVLQVIGNGQKVSAGTTMMFFLPAQEDTLGHYIDTLTFSIVIEGEIQQGGNQ